MEQREFHQYIPQRQQNAENGAVVERVMRGKAAQKACINGAAERDNPQRQRNSGNGAVVERVMRGKAAQKACINGAAERDIPQRQRNAGNGAVVEERGERGKTVIGKRWHYGTRDGERK